MGYNVCRPSVLGFSGEGTVTPRKPEKKSLSSDLAVKNSNKTSLSKKESLSSGDKISKKPKKAKDKK